MTSKITTFSLLFIIALSSNAQLTTNSTALTPAQLVQNILVGTGITVSSVTYTGDPTGRGEFNGAASNIGFSSGVMLASGPISNAIGPNNTSSMTGAGTGLSTDPELTSIATGSVNDAAILEFDFVPVSDSIKFRYVFGSEEYMEFVGTSFNDVFGFFISGTNPSGGMYSNQNIAIIPGTASTPVSINNVNLGAFGIYYFDNGDGFGSGTAPDGLTIQYDGFTVPLTAKAAVNCGETYHIKIAIADVGDGAYDSGVFLEAGSFSAAAVSIVPEISYGGANDTTLYEGCGAACIYFVRTSNLTANDTITMAITGTALNGTDYTDMSGNPLPDSLFFAPGVDSISFCIVAISDGITEGLESMVLSITQTGPCLTTSTTATLYIDEHDPLVLITHDTTLCNPGETAILFTNVTGGVEPYTYTWSGGLPSISNPSVTPAATSSYIVTVSDACNAMPVDPTPDVTDTVTVNVVVTNNLVSNAGADITVCPGDQFCISSLVNGGANPYNICWTYPSGSDSLVGNPCTPSSLCAMGNAGGTYILTAVDFCWNTSSDTLVVSVETTCTVSIPNVVTPGGNGPEVNNFFYITGLEKYPNSKLEIYNRWGKRIYSSSNYLNDWNGGRYNDGTYYYLLTLPDSRNMKGFFQIIHGS